MKKIIITTVLFIALISCEKPSDCIESAGNTITKIVEVTPFTRVEVYSGIELIITQGAEYKVEIVTGENIIENVEVKQEGNILKLKENSSCNWVREYGQTKVYITAPNIEDIYSKSDRKISSNGVLTYPILRLFALDKDGDGKEGAGTSDFYINVNNSQLVIENNNVARFFIAGNTDELLLNFYFGDGRFEGENLIAKKAKVYHRGSNDMIVKPTESITGKIVSIGDVILKNNPPIIEVEELYQGQVIYF